MVGFFPINRDGPMEYLFFMLINLYALYLNLLYFVVIVINLLVNACLWLNETLVWAGETVQQITVLYLKGKELSSIPKTHMVSRKN